jgi:hypothetical protein
MTSVLDAVAQHLPEVHDDVRHRAVEVCQELLRER